MQRRYPPLDSSFQEKSRWRRKKRRTDQRMRNGEVKLVLYGGLISMPFSPMDEDAWTLDKRGGDWGISTGGTKMMHVQRARVTPTLAQ